MLLDAILRLHDKIMHQPLGPNGRKALAAKEARHGAPVVAPGAMPSSYRFNKKLRAEWEQAVAEGREEQLRIQKWMERGVKHQ
jgi:NADH-quinone oxidoreductase subunit B